jgi:probable phosphoglycerate mutase
MSGVAVAVLRHAATAWNEDGRLQGMTDTVLSLKGEADAKTWRLPAPCERWKRFSSPLQRARRTAELLQPAAQASVEGRLREMSFGAWEGRSVAELRETFGETFSAAENKGLDFQPPGGESPRAVMERIAGWLVEVAASGEPVVAVSHKAVIRAVLVLATGWNMMGRPPVRLDWRSAHFFHAYTDGTVRLDRPNVALTEQ